MRPKSAKLGARVSDNDDDQESRDIREPIGFREQIKTESQKNKNRMLSAANQRRFVNIVKPVQMATGEFTRIMPKHIYQDKERLYSEALQLKRSHWSYTENMHDIIDENMKLKTKIAVLEREKEKLSKVCNQEMTGKVYATGSNNNDTGMVTKLKKMLRSAQEQARDLQNEGKKLKKTVKYTKISELQVENKTLIQESIRLNRILEELMEQKEQDANRQNRLEELEAFLKAKMEENEDLINTNRRITEEVLTLQQNMKSSQTKSAEREKKYQKDLSIAKRRTADSQRQIDHLNAQITKLREQKIKQQPTSQLANNSIRPKTGEPANAADNKNRVKTINELEILRKKNAELQAKVQQLIKSQNPKVQDQQTKVKEKNQSNRSKDKQSIDQNNPKSNLQEFKERTSVPQQNVGKHELLPKAEESSPNKSHFEQSDLLVAPKLSAQFPSEKPNQQRNSYEDEQFEQPQQKDVHIQNPAQPKNTTSSQKKSPPKVVRSTEMEHSNVKFEQYKEDFAVEDDEKNDQQILYKKEEKKPATSAKKKKVTTKTKSSSNKKQLTELSELLTYRMKAQRYLFNELQQDIIDSSQSEFSINELQSMLQNSPFFLTEQQVNRILQYFFDNIDKFDNTIVLPVNKLIEKLRKLIKNFQLLEEQEQENMDMRIAQMVTTYASELQAAFEQKRNGPDTIAKAELEDLFKQLELQSAYIELIISRLSLMSEDLNHLNYYEFFREFYQGDDMRVQEVDQEYDPSNSRTLNRNNHMIQEEQVEESEESKRSKKHTDKRKAGRKPAYNIQ